MGYASARRGTLKRTITWFLKLVALLVINNFFKAQTIVDGVRKCSESVAKEALLADRQFQQLLDDIKTWSMPPVFILLNSYAVNMTLNWLCNTAAMDAVHSHTVIVAVDDEAKNALLAQWPKLRIVLFRALCLQETFKPGDAKYLTFFLFRTNLIRSLLTANRPFWLLQADTFWRENLFVPRLDLAYNGSDVLLDQQGFHGTNQLRRAQMNGANFLVYPTKRSVELFDRLAWFQTNIYVTDADAIKVMCHDTTEYDCRYIPYSYVSGWEWIYGDQSDPPYWLQMDGETQGGKGESMRKYYMWFLHDNASCDSAAVRKASALMGRGQIPRLLSSSKMKQKFLLGIGQILASIPYFGRIYMQYGGIPSMYLQFF